MDGKAQIKIFNHLPDRGASMLFEAIEQMDSIAHHEIVEAQNKFVAIMSELKDQGRI
jgi:flagellar motor switch protein FliG